MYMTLQVRRRRPECRLSLQYDKLYVDNAAYIYSEDSQEVELLHTPEIMETQYQVGG